MRRLTLFNSTTTKDQDTYTYPLMTSNNSSPLPSPAESSSRPYSRDESEEPPRKRARSEVSSDQRREARAHRNRIAAQNSRDKRKAHFSYLEQRVGELEDENHKLRAGMGLTQHGQSEKQKVADLARESAKDRENQELKERIKTLESGWSAVVQALQASGLPLNLATPPPAGSTPSSASQQPSTFPVFFPISPALSQTSLSSSNLLDEFEATRHLARVATIDDAQLIPMSQQRVASQQLRYDPNSHRRRHPTTTRSRPSWMRSLWRNSYARSSLPPPLPLHQRRLYLMKLFRQLPKSPPTTPRRR